MKKKMPILPFVFTLLFHACREEIVQDPTTHDDGGRNAGVTSVMSCGATGRGDCRYVTPSGSATNFCPIEAPCTLQRAAAIVNPGDEVLVADGDYTTTSCTGCYLLTIARGGTPTDKVVFKSINRHGARLFGRNNAIPFAVRVDASYVRLEGFEITEFGDLGVYNVAGGQDSEIVGNHIHDIGRRCTGTGIGLDAIYVNRGNVTIDGNMIHDIGRFAPNESGCDPAVARYYENNDHGIYVNSSTNLIIRNNIFYNMDHGWSVQMYSSTSSNLNILNNTFAFPNTLAAPGHIILAANISGANIRNNIFYQPRTAAVRIYSGTMSNVIISDNITTASAMTDRSYAGVVVSSSNRLSTDSRLVNPTAYNFHLQSGSPAIDSGAFLSMVEFDFDGTSRPQGAGFDIGAFEFVSSSPDPTTSTINGGVIIGGTVQGVPDPMGSFSMIVKDAFSHPIPNIRVDLDLSDCDYVSVCPDPKFNPLTRIFSGTTNSAGEITMNIAGSAVLPQAQLGGGACATLKTGGVSFPTPLPVAVMNLDGSEESPNGVAIDPNDLSTLLGDLFGGEYRPRSDFVADGKLDPNDLSVWLNRFFNGAVSGCR